MSADSVGGLFRNTGGLVYHVVVNLDPGAIPIRVNYDPVGGLWHDRNACPVAFASGCEGWVRFHAPMRDSAGVKLLPKIRSVQWEDFSGVIDSIVPPYDPELTYDCRPWVIP